MTTKKDMHDGNGFWTPERIAAHKADPRNQDPNNWAANPTLTDEDEAILAKIDAERVAEAMVEKAMSKSMTKRVTALKEAKDKPKGGKFSPEVQAEIDAIPKDPIPDYVPKVGKDGTPANTRSGRFTSDGDDGGMTVIKKKDL